jgi:hypothetical protein
MFIEQQDVVSIARIFFYIYLTGESYLKEYINEYNFHCFSSKIATIADFKSNSWA